MKITMKKIVKRALRDKAFLNALIENSAGALEKEGWELSAADSRALKSILKRAYTLSGAELLSMHALIRASSGESVVKPWPSGLRRSLQIKKRRR
jgi:hypothetical protein